MRARPPPDNKNAGPGYIIYINLWPYGAVLRPPPPPPNNYFLPTPLILSLQDVVFLMSVLSSIDFVPTQSWLTHRQGDGGKRKIKTIGNASGFHMNSIVLFLT